MNFKHLAVLALLLGIPTASTSNELQVPNNEFVAAQQSAARCVGFPDWAIKELDAKFPHNALVALEFAGRAGFSRGGIKITVNDYGTPDCKTAKVPPKGEGGLLVYGARQPVAAFLTRPINKKWLQAVAIMEVDSGQPGKRSFYTFTGILPRANVGPNRAVRT